MADDHMFLAHKGAGVAIWVAKMLGNDWTSRNVTENWNTLMLYLLDGLDKWTNPGRVQPTKEQKAAFWDSYQSDTDDFVLVREASFHKTWTTPSGLLFCVSDYIMGAIVEPAIFRVSFDEELIRKHRNAR